MAQTKISIPKKFTGYATSEPSFSKITQKNRNNIVLTAFNFYNYYFCYKEAHGMVGDFLLREKRTEEYAKWKKVPMRAIPNAIGWYCRMIGNGYPATTEELAKINTAIARAFMQVPVKTPVNTDDEDSAKKKANIQEIMREKANLLGGELEYMLDVYIKDGVKAKHQLEPINTIKLSNILPQHIPILTEHWEHVLAEFKELHFGSDKDLIESYDYLTKTQSRRLIKFTELIIADLNSYITFKKASKAKPARKTKTPLQQVAKLKYLRKFPDLSLVSIKPEKIIGVKEMFVYSTKKRKLHYYVADESAGNALMVKNSSIVGFDPNKTVMKTIRKPLEVLKPFMKASRPATRKMFQNINAVEARLSGRFQDDYVILKVW